MQSRTGESKATVWSKQCDSMLIKRCSDTAQK